MAELRRFTIHAVEVPESHVGMQTFAKLPKIAVSQWVGFYAMLAPILIMVLTVTILAQINQKDKAIGMSLIVFGGILSFVGFAFCLRFVHSLFEAKQARKDKQTFEASKNETHIGVAYVDHFWEFRNDTSWDRGFLTYDKGFLCFRGFGPEFRLPVANIHDIWLATTGPSPFGSTRIFVRWVHPESGFNTFSLEIRSKRSVRERLVKAEELANSVRSLLGNVDGERDKAIWPFQSSSLNFARYPDHQVVEWKDVFMAALSGLFWGSITSLLVYLFAWLTKIESASIVVIGFVSAKFWYTQRIYGRVLSKGQ
jgi:hypothetical protein